MLVVQVKTSLLEQRRNALPPTQLKKRQIFLEEVFLYIFVLVYGFSECAFEHY